MLPCLHENITTLHYAFTIQDTPRHLEIHLQNPRHGYPNRRLRQHQSRPFPSSRSPPIPEREF
jgi:hypothetical protein